MLKQEAHGPYCSPEKTVKINKHIWLSSFWFREGKTYYLLYEKWMVLHLYKLEFSSPKDALCQIWLKLAMGFLRKRFLNFVNEFLLFRNYLPLEQAGAFIRRNLNSLHPSMLCAKFGWNWPSGSWEEDENVKSLRQRLQQHRQQWRTTEKLTSASAQLS